jgi:hypothetical protein
LSGKPLKMQVLRLPFTPFRVAQDDRYCVVN